MRDNLLTLTTELRNQKSMSLPKMSIDEAIQMMNKEDEACIQAVKEVLPAVNESIEACIQTLNDGGRVVFIGAAHSGYLGMLDAYEANATFGTNGEFVAIVAGHATDIMKTDGSAEDNLQSAIEDLKEIKISKKDFVIGISSSGRTPYTVSALSYCRENKIKCACLVNNKNSLISEVSDIIIDPTPGAEVITGSTRLKAGTTQKMILNMITTISMSKMGNVFENLMINVPPASNKMRTRLAYILMQATGCNLEKSNSLLKECDYQIKIALLMELQKIPKDEAIERLKLVKKNINLIL